MTGRVPQEERVDEPRRPATNQTCPNCGAFPGVEHDPACRWRPLAAGSLAAPADDAALARLTKWLTVHGYTEWRDAVDGLAQALADTRETLVREAEFATLREESAINRAVAAEAALAEARARVHVAEGFITPIQRPYYDREVAAAGGGHGR